MAKRFKGVGCMVECNDCFDYALEIYLRGEIGKADIRKLSVDRHKLKGCRDFVVNEIKKTEDLLIALREKLRNLS